jgi:hypothetical protein
MGIEHRMRVLGRIQKSERGERGGGLRKLHNSGFITFILRQMLLESPRTGG